MVGIPSPCVFVGPGLGVQDKTGCEGKQERQRTGGMLDEIFLSKSSERGDPGQISVKQITMVATLPRVRAD